MRLIKTTWIYLFSLFFPLLALSAELIPEQEPNRQYIEVIMKEVNQHRQSQGLQPLITDDFIAEQAQRHSNNMAGKKIELGHRDFKVRIQRVYDHFQFPRGGSENVAHYSLSPEEIVKKWLLSPGHRKNIEGDYNLTGIGVAADANGGMYCTQIFVKADDPQHLS